MQLDNKLKILHQKLISKANGRSIEQIPEDEWLSIFGDSLKESGLRILNYIQRDHQTKLLDDIRKQGSDS